MVSRKKINKQKNAFMHPTLLKNKIGKLKGGLFFTSSQRQEEKRRLRNDER